MRTTVSTLRHLRHLRIVGGLVLALAALPAGRAAAQTVDSKWLTVNSSAKLLIFRLEAGMGAENGGMNMNGFHDGGLTLTVPVGWKTIVYFHNASERTPHHAAVVAYTPTPPEGTVTPAFKGAETGAATYTVVPNGRHMVQFTAAVAGQYMVTCTVPSHGSNGMWIKLNVDPGASEPTLVASK